MNDMNNMHRVFQQGNLEKKLNEAIKQQNQSCYIDVAVLKSLSSADINTYLNYQNLAQLFTDACANSLIKCPSTLTFDKLKLTP